MDNRYPTLGKTIWGRVVNIQSWHLAMRHGTVNVQVEAERKLAEEERALWGELQVLFRGGVFDEDMPKVEADEPLAGAYWRVAPYGMNVRHLVNNERRGLTLCGRELGSSTEHGHIEEGYICSTCRKAAKAGMSFWRIIVDG